VDNSIETIWLPGLIELDFETICSWRSSMTAWVRLLSHKYSRSFFGVFFRMLVVRVRASLSARNNAGNTTTTSVRVFAIGTDRYARRNGAKRQSVLSNCAVTIRAHDDDKIRTDEKSCDNSRDTWCDITQPRTHPRVLCVCTTRKTDSATETPRRSAADPQGYGPDDARSYFVGVFTMALFTRFSFWSTCLSQNF